MNYQHSQLAAGRWFKLSLVEQLANIGSEVERTIIWKQKGNPDYSMQALYRAVELMILTNKDKKNQKRLKEICRLKEILLDYFIGENQYHSSDLLWRKYFYPFYILARKNPTS